MSVFKLSDKLEFPPPYLAEPSGLLCVGGDLSTERLLLAYSSGIFPWYSDDEPILWWSPDPRLILYPKKINISKSLKKKLTIIILPLQWIRHLKMLSMHVLVCVPKIAKKPGLLMK